MDIQIFRTNNPEFANVRYFPDAQIARWLAVGGKLLSADRWGELLDHGLELFVAHHISLTRQNQKTAAAGGSVGQSSGPVSGKTVDKVTVSYDTASATELNAGHWNLTTYGTQYIRLARMIGAGGLQL